MKDALMGEAWAEVASFGRIWGGNPPWSLSLLSFERCAGVKRAET